MTTTFVVFDAACSNPVAMAVCFSGSLLYAVVHGEGDVYSQIGQPREELRVAFEKHQSNEQIAAWLKSRFETEYVQVYQTSRGEWA